MQVLATEYQLDAVSICSPPATHLDNSRACIDAGIAILCEKPFEATLDRARQLAALVRERNALFMPAFCHRFHPAILELKALIAAGTLGEPLLFRNIFGGYVALAGNHRADPALAGGGVLIDNGCHAIDLFRFLIGEPAAVQAVAGNVQQALAVEDFGMIHLTTAGRAFGQILSSYSLHGCPNVVELFGSLGSATVTYFDDVVPDLVYRLAGAAPVVVDCSALPDRFSAEVAHFLDCVRTGKTPRITVEDGVRANAVIAAAYASVASGAIAHVARS